MHQALQASPWPAGSSFRSAAAVAAATATTLYHCAHLFWTILICYLVCYLHYRSGCRSAICPTHSYLSDCPPVLCSGSTRRSRLRRSGRRRLLILVGPPSWSQLLSVSQLSCLRPSSLRYSYENDYSRECSSLINSQSLS